MTGLELQELLSNSFETLGVDLNYLYVGKRPLDVMQIPLDTVADLNDIPSAYRYKGMTVTVLSGSTLDSKGKNIPDEYWLVGGTKNSNWQKKPSVTDGKLSLSANAENSTIELLYDGQPIGVAADLSDMLSEWQNDQYISSGGIVTENGIKYLELYYNDETVEPVRIDLSGIGGTEPGQQTEGAQGPQGAEGAQGSQGSQGPQGKAFEYEDFTPEQIEALRGPEGPQGKGFDYEDFTPEQIEALRGPQGSMGVDGAQGPQGEKGEDGAQGPQGLEGAQGAQGTQGPSATFEVGEGLSMDNETLSVDKEFVREVAISAITDSLIPQDAKEALDTLEEIADYIQNHPDEVSAYTSYVTELRERLEVLSGITDVRIDEVKSQIDELHQTLSGANENVIEEVRVDGVALPVVDKSVDIVLSGFATTSYVDNAFEEYATSADTEAAIAVASRPSLSANTYTDGRALATADNVGKIIDVKNEEDVSGVTYSDGLYIVAGAGEISKLGVTSATGDLSGDIENLKGRVGTLESNVSSIMDYLYWETDDELEIE